MTDLFFSMQGYVCRPIAKGLTQVITPFNLGCDSNAITFFIEQTDTGLLLRDRGNAAFHAANHGCALTARRWKTLRQLMTGTATLTPDWELQAKVDDAAAVSFAAADMITAAIRLTTDALNVKPKSTRRFFDRVGEMLSATVGSRLKRGEKIIGVSGHPLDIPFVIEASVPRLVQPVAAQVDGANWDGVYKAYGKLDDIKQAGADHTKRYVILEDILQDAEQDAVFTYLSRVASVLLFSQRAEWIERLVAEDGA